MPAASTIGALTAEAWRQCYLDPARARAVGHELVELGATDIGWFHIALAEIRIGSEDAAMTALARSREAFTVSRDRCGLALCDELQAIHLRHTQDLAGSHALQRDIDGRAALDYTPVQQFIAQNSRALTAKLLGQTEEALRRFYAALDAARRSELAGPQVTALGNLGGYHQALFNRQDARLLCEQALETAQRIGARQAVGTALANLIMIQHGEGEPGQAMDTARSLEAMLPQLAPTTVGRFTTFIALACFGAGDIDGAQQRLDLAAASSVADGDGISRWAWLTARCHLARGDASAARRTAVDTLASQRPSPPYDIVELHRVAADACEVLGDVAAALAYTRSAHAHYESMVGHSARARYIALQVGHELVHARQERDDAELNLRRMAELNRALQAKIAETELLHAQLREQALRDPLTGLHNRRYLFEVGPGLHRVVTPRRHAAVRSGARPRPLQGPQRRLRPPGRRPGAAALRAAADPWSAAQRRRLPPWRRGVRRR